MVNAGKYLAKVAQYGVGETSTGKTQLQILFNFKDEQGVEQGLWWYGYTTDKAIPISARALVSCGMKGLDLARFAEGEKSGLLDMKAQVEIEVKHEEYNGKTQAKIAWVNKPGGSKFMDPKMAAQKMAGLNFGPALAAAKHDAGVVDKDEDNLPF